MFSGSWKSVKIIYWSSIEKRTYFERDRDSLASRDIFLFFEYFRRRQRTVYPRVAKKEIASNQIIQTVLSDEDASLDGQIHYYLGITDDI